MPENGDPNGRRNTRVQEFEALGAEFGLKHGHPCDVSAGSGEARDVAGPYWICMADEDDGNGGCRRFQGPREEGAPRCDQDRKSTRLNSSHSSISYAVFCLKKKKITELSDTDNPH